MIELNNLLFRSRLKIEGGWDKINILSENKYNYFISYTKNFTILILYVAVIKLYYIKK